MKWINDNWWKLGLVTFGVLFVGIYYNNSYESRRTANYKYCREHYAEFADTEGQGRLSAFMDSRTGDFVERMTSRCMEAVESQ